MMYRLIVKFKKIHGIESAKSLTDVDRILEMNFQSLSNTFRTDDFNNN